MLKLATAAALLASLGGCIIHPGHGFGGHHPGGLIEDDCPDPDGSVVVERDCRHHDGCGHYWHNGSWYQVHGHVHGSGCGHHFHEGRWVRVGSVSVNRGHVCTGACRHYYHGGQWYAAKAHVHGAGCGHTLRGGAWITVRW